jgi:hypothetical protein
LNTGTPDRAALAAQLCTLVDNRLLDPLEILLASDLMQLRTLVVEQSDTWAALLLGENKVLAVRTAIRLVSALYPSDGPFNPPAQWWQTPLGRIVAQRVGHPGAETVSYAVAGAMLGVTRQGVHDLVRRGKLTRHQDGGVTTASVRDRLNNRAAASVRDHRGEGEA